MKTIIISVVACALVLAMAGLIGNLSTKFASERAALMADNAALKAQLEHANMQLGQLQALEAKAKALAAQVEAITPPERPAEAPEAPVPAEAAVGQDREAAPTPDDKKNPMDAMMKMFQGEGGKKMREAGARAQMEMQYGAFLKDLALPADVDAQVRDVLIAHANSQMERAMGFLDKDKTMSGKEMRGQEDTGREELRAQLAQVLSSDELAQWDEYEAELPRHVLEQNFNMQLNMFASNLSEETRQIVRDTLVEESLAAQAEQATSESPMQFDSQLEQQSAVYANAREALASTLTDEEFQQVDRFLTQQEEMMQASMTMIRGMLEDDIPGSPSEPVGGGESQP